MIRHLVKELLAERGNLMAEFRVWILKVKPMSDICDDFRCWFVSKYCLKHQVMICFHLWNFSFKKLIYGKPDLSFTFAFFYLSFPRMENALISQLTYLGQGKKNPVPSALTGRARKWAEKHPRELNSCGWPRQTGAQRRSLHASSDSPAGR